MKALKIIGILIVVLIIALFAIILNLGKIVKTGINTVVPQVTKCEAHVDDGKATRPTTPSRSAIFSSTSIWAPS